MIRDLMLTDVEEVVALLQILRTESPEYEYVEDDPKFVASNMDKLVYHDMLKGVVYEDDAEIVGFMVGFIANPWYSRRVDAIEQLLYVHPDRRGGTIALRLVRGFEKVCKEAGAYELQVGASTGMKEDRTVRMYQKMGYKLRSPTLVKRL